MSLSVYRYLCLFKFLKLYTFQSEILRREVLEANNSDKRLFIFIVVITDKTCSLHNINILQKWKKYSVLEENNFKKQMHFSYICFQNEDFSSSRTVHCLTMAQSLTFCKNKNWLAYLCRNEINTLYF